jgi:hypothetical protein
VKDVNAIKSALLIIGLALTLAGCRADVRGHAPKDSSGAAGAVSYAIVPAAASAAYTLKRSEHAFGAQPVVRDPPVYPPSLVARQLPPVIVHAKVVVDEQGHVVDVRDMDSDSSSDHSAFFDACREAVGHWQFTPMTVVEEFDDGKGNISQSRKNAAFSLDYAFRFELVAGKPTVPPQG